MEIISINKAKNINNFINIETYIIKNDVPSKEESLLSLK